MNVKELIDALSVLDPNTNVVIGDYVVSGIIMGKGRVSKEIDARGNRRFTRRSVKKPDTVVMFGLWSEDADGENRLGEVGPWDFNTEVD